MGEYLNAYAGGMKGDDKLNSISNNNSNSGNIGNIGSVNNGNGNNGNNGNGNNGNSNGSGGNAMYKTNSLVDRSALGRVAPPQVSGVCAGCLWWW